MLPSRVLVIDDHPIVRQGVAGLLADETDLELVAESDSGLRGLAMAERSRPDIILLDLKLPDLPAPKVCSKLLTLLPDAKVVILTAFDDIGLLRACVKAGASAVLLKDVREYSLVDSLREVRAGRLVIDEQLTNTSERRPAVFRDPEGNVYDALTEREHDVLRLIAVGMTSREVADELHLSPNTVRSYAQSLLSKLHANNRIQAIATARRLRLI